MKLNYNSMDQLGEVVKYILYRCRENNTPITEIMASFIAQTVFNMRSSLFTQAPTNSILKINSQSQKCASLKRQLSKRSSLKKP